MNIVSRPPAILLLSACAIAATLFVLWKFSTALDQPAAPEGGVATQHPSVTSWRRAIDQQFAFDDACAECHQAEFEAHQRSGHSHTATPMERSQLASVLNGSNYEDTRRSQTFQFAAREQGFYVGIQGTDEAPVFPVHWLLGSGSHAQTPVSIDPRSRMGVEFRWTWLSHADRLGVTPDHERFDDYREGTLECFGRPLDADQALACVACHMTVAPPASVVPSRDAFVPNVGCERCHGPRKEHVQLARQGLASESKPLITYHDAESYIRQCAQCHRDETNIPGTSQPSELARYQPYGLLKSRCYLDSDGQLSCANCHDPHDRTSRDAKAYISACNSCHQAEQQTRCPVEPAGDCVQCHMPAVEWHSGISFHDHWIRVQQPESDEQTIKSAMGSPAEDPQRGSP